MSVWKVATEIVEIEKNEDLVSNIVSCGTAVMEFIQLGGDRKGYTGEGILSSWDGLEIEVYLPTQDCHLNIEQRTAWKLEWGSWVTCGS
jgi:hypothetical protein